MNKPNQSNSEFLSKFIKEEKYLQNHPLEANEFESNCKERGIITDERELEFFEKEKLLFPILRIDLPVIKKDEKEIDGFNTISYSSYAFGVGYKKLLSNWLEEGNLYDPSIKPFKCWKNYKDDIGRKKTVSFYSSYQIYWLSMLKRAFSFNINFIGDDIKVSSFLPNIYDFENNATFSIIEMKVFYEKLKEVSEKQTFKEYFNFKGKKEILEKEYKIFNQLLKFLINIQNIYYPFARSGSKTISISGDQSKWFEMKKDFNLNNELNYLNLKIEDVARWYWILSNRSKEILGASGSDWAQLWKNISWDKKKKLEGNNRLGIDYLQWAVMLKRVIEEFLVREIPDIDEIINFGPGDVLKVKTNSWNCQQHSLRSIRNSRFLDIDLEDEKLLNSIFKKIVKPVVNKTELEEEFSKFKKMGFYIDWNDKTICFDEKKLNVKNFYHDKYKRLFYLSNSFKLDYQPRVIVFVEGKTEEKILPRIFKWHYGTTPDSLGIEFIDFKGVDQLLSTSKNAEKLRKLLVGIEINVKQKIKSNENKKTLNKLIKDFKKVDIVTSNWTSFLSYNLEKWQIFPFFLSDNEGNIKHFLQAETPISFMGKNYNVPQEWYYLWGVDNQNTPFTGDNFELANFSNHEITTAIKEILESAVEDEEVQKLREIKKGINALGPEVKYKKIEINEKLVDNMFNNYEKDQDDSSLKRPIFKVIKKITDLAPIRIQASPDRRVELMNINYIEKILSKL
jgi:hypothetical protein